MTRVGRSVLRTAARLWRRMHPPPARTTPAALREVQTLESVLDKKLYGKVAIITGAAGGLGSATARLFAAHGAQIIVADIQEEKGHDLCSEIGSNAHYRHCDVTKEVDIASTVDFAVDKFGKLDIMHNNAGIITAEQTFKGLNLDAYDQGTSIMVRGVVAGIKHASRVMIPNKQGVILNTASTASVSTGLIPIVYNINKENIPGLTRIAAYHLGKHGIRVNAVSPSVVFTPLVHAYLRQIPGGENFTFEEMRQAFIGNSSLVGKICTEQDVANAALFLCSDDSGYVSGQNLVIDGGWCSSKEYNVVDDLLRMETSRGSGTSI